VQILPHRTNRRSRTGWGSSRFFRRRGVVTPDPGSGPLKADPARHRVFANIVRYALAPAIFCVSGFFTVNFLISGLYTWPRTSRVLALTLTLVVLSYEFVYKEQIANAGSMTEARSALLYACVIPYVIGAVLMLVLWKL
jgi:hypothetical protein